MKTAGEKPREIKKAVSSRNGFPFVKFNDLSALDLRVQLLCKYVFTYSTNLLVYNLTFFKY